MPQINRIRVNNVKYNFGTQFYDDFLMRFNCKNTIYDLANGGGKSLSEKEAATPAYTHLLSGSLIIMQLKMVSDI